MALIKAVILPNGISGNYWRITSVSIDKKNMKISCVLELYTGVFFIHEKPIPNTAKGFAFTATPVEMDGNVIELCYSKIKEQVATHPTNPNLSQLTGAVDG